MKLAKYIFVASLLLALSVIIYFVLKVDNSEDEIGSIQLDETKIDIGQQNEKLPSQIVENIDFGGRLKSGEIQLRFDPSKHPASSEKAASSYYSEYKVLLFPDEPFPEHLDEKMLKNLRNGKDLHLTLGQIGRLEIIEAVPHLIILLKESKDPSILRKSAKLLAKFGKKEGIEFLLDNYGSKELSVQQLLFDTVTSNERKEYLPQITNMLSVEMKRGKWYGRPLARILAYFGDKNALDFYLPKLTSSKNLSDLDLELLANIRDLRLVEPIKKQFSESDKPWTKVTAAYVLTQQGETDYQKVVIEKALLGLSMPNATVDLTKFNAWSQRNNGENGTSISRAMKYLPKIASTQSVETLEKIAASKTVFSKNAIIGLAEVETRQSRDSLLRLVTKVKGTSNQIYLAKALTLYKDQECSSIASSLFDTERGKRLNFFLARTKGCKGLFKENIKR